MKILSCCSTDQLKLYFDKVTQSSFTQLKTLGDINGRKCLQLLAASPLSEFGASRKFVSLNSFPSYQGEASNKISAQSVQPFRSVIVIRHIYPQKVWPKTTPGPTGSFPQNFNSLGLPVSQRERHSIFIVKRYIYTTVKPGFFRISDEPVYGYG